MTRYERSHALSFEALESLCEEAVLAAGGSPETAAILAAATVAAERRGNRDVGAAHLPDYLDALRHGRLNGAPEPSVTSSRTAIVMVDADRGIAQLAFEHAVEEFSARARAGGIAMLSMRNAFAAGELGYFTTRLADAGLIAVAGANSPALMAAFGAREAVTGTNPLSFALPHPSGPRMFDQAASETAWVTVRDAAEQGEEIPSGWALDAQGRPTVDARSALSGALLPFGGVKGANIAMMVEMLAAMAGGSFSLDAAPFDSGGTSPRLGLFVIAIDPTAVDPDYPERAEEHLRRLTAEHGVDVGRRKQPPPEVELPAAIHRALLAR